MPSNPITPLQQAKRDLRQAIDEHVRIRRNAMPLSHDVTQSTRKVEDCIEELIAQAQAAVVATTPRG